MVSAMNSLILMLILERTRGFLEGRLMALGQIGGYTSGVLAWLTGTREVFGSIGVVCGGLLSLWALVEKARKEYRAWSRKKRTGKRVADGRS